MAGQADNTRSKEGNMSNFAPCGQWSLFWPVMDAGAFHEGVYQVPENLRAKAALIAPSLSLAPIARLFQHTRACVCVCVCVKQHAVRRQKMRFADRWSLKHIYNEPSHVGLWLTWS